MDRINLQATERNLLGKKVKRLRRDGHLPGHVFGKGLKSEHVSVDAKDFLKIFHQAGETGLLDLKIDEEKIRPVLIRDIQYDPVTGKPLHIDFYQVNLKEKVTVPVPLVLVGDEPEMVHTGEAIVLQNLNEVSVEALPTDLVEKIEVDIASLKAVDDAITVGDLNYDREVLTILEDGEEIVVKLAPAVTVEMEKLMEEQKAEAEIAQAEAAAAAEGEPRPEGREEGVEAPAEGEEAAPEGEKQIPAEGETAPTER